MEAEDSRWSGGGIPQPSVSHSIEKLSVIRSEALGGCCKGGRAADGVMNMCEGEEGYMVRQTLEWRGTGLCVCVCSYVHCDM